METSLTQTWDAPRRFALRRLADPTGVSGTGYVAWGVRFANGQVILQWRGQHTGIQQLSIYQHLEDILALHGHQGSTLLDWLETVPIDWPL